MNNHSSFKWLFLPLALLTLLSFVLFIERSGLSYSSAGSAPINFLDPMEKSAAPAVDLDAQKECLVLFDPQGEEGLSVSETVTFTLLSMRVRFDQVDVNLADPVDLESYDTVVIAFTDLDKIQEWILDLTEWVEQGGQVLFAIRPNPSQSFTAIYRKMGILSKNDELVTVEGVKFTSDLFPGAKNISLGKDFLHHDSIPVQLDDRCSVHMVSADQFELPILWSCDYGNGRMVVLNSNQFSNKSARGTIAAAYSLLPDMFIYPVINSATFFIDDFPSPIPDGEHELVTSEFGRNLKSFYINVWWPDMQSYARRYGIKYTGVVIETYDDNVNPPFVSQTNEETFVYLANSLMRAGGEIGWHGYNHVPLCLADSDCNNQLGYPSWPSEDAMRSALEELYSFSTALAGEQTITTYVPPSNVLSSQARAWLADALPGLRVIASVYLPDTDNSEYAQEFMESPDGIIELPRIFAGFIPSDYMHWTAINELMLHYVHSQFVHPDDILDEERSGGHGWTYLRDSLDDYLLWLYSSATEIRNMTASEGAMAVQRYDRLEVMRNLDSDGYAVHLDNFYDEAYLLLRSVYIPAAVTGGESTKITEGLYLIKALQPDLLIQFSENKTQAAIAIKEDAKEEEEETVIEQTPEIIPVTASSSITAADELRIGSRVIVNGTENRGLRMRKDAGLEFSTVFFAREGEEYLIVAGPKTMDDMVWWQIQSTSQANRTGWSSQDYLLPVGAGE